MADSIVRQALADLRAALARAEAALETLEAQKDSRQVPGEVVPAPNLEQAAAFAALQRRLAAVDRWPAVQSAPWVSTDEINTATFGQHIGHDFRAGLAELSFELAPASTPWLTSATVGGAGISVGVLLEGLPGLLALLADERVGALLARDGWTIPPVLAPMLAQIAQRRPAD